MHPSPVCPGCNCVCHRYDSLFATAATGTLCLLSAERDGVGEYFASKPALAAFVVLTSSVLASLHLQTLALVLAPIPAAPSP